MPPPAAPSAHSEPTRRSTALRLVAETWDLSDLPAHQLPVGPPPSASFPLPRLAGFEVGPELGHGSMGRVYRAHDLERERAVALKVSAGAGEDEVRRFGLEVELQRSLRHPAIPLVLGSGRLGDGRGYLVQTLIEGGRPLDQAARGARAAQIAEWIATAADVLTVAHARCVTHGDLKPDNLLVDGRGRLFVIDWGVSRLALCSAPSPAALSPAAACEATRTRDWVEGTLAYMPPEQLRAHPEPASDVYALGVVLFELLCGRHPRAEHLGDVDELIHATLHGPLPRIPNRVPPPLRELLEACLQADPRRRPASGALRATLRRYLRTSRRRSA